MEIFEEGGGGQRYDYNSKLDMGDRVDTVSTNSNLSLHTAPHPNTKYILSQISFQKLDAAKPQQLDVTKNVYSEKATESRNSYWLRNSANRKPGGSVRGVKRKVSDSDNVSGIKKQRNRRGYGQQYY